MIAERAELEAAARLFKALSTPARLQLLCLLADGPATVSRLVELSGLSQPLVSQHLRILRETGLVALTRTGREAVHALADTHVSHIVADAVTHAAEGLVAPDSTKGFPRPGRGEENLSDGGVVAAG